MFRKLSVFFVLVVIGSLSVNAAQGMDFLKVSDTQIVRVNDHAPMLLRGFALSNGVFNDSGEASTAMPGWAVNEADVRFIKEKGANVVRYAFSYKWLLEEKGFEKIDQDLALFEKYGVYVILNMHVPPGSGAGWGKTVGADLFDGENWALFTKLWRKIARRYRGRAVIAAYEPFSEPKPADYQYLVEKTKEIIVVIRKVEGGTVIPHIIVVTKPEALKQNGQVVFKSLPLFKVDDPNILYTFHFYSPWEFTHQPEAKDFPWLSEGTKVQLPKEFRYPTQYFGMPDEFNQAKMEALIKTFVDWAKENNVPLYLGEFGATNRAPIEDKIKWVADVLGLAKKYQLNAWTYWDYKGAYGWRYDFSLINVLPDNLAEQNVWTQKHDREDFGKVNLMNEPIIGLLSRNMSIN